MLDIYICPYSSAQLQNNFFTKSVGITPPGSEPLWQYVRNYLASQGLRLNTIDLFSAASQDCSFVALSRVLVRFPGWGRYVKWARTQAFRKRVLIHTEPPSLTPDMYVFTRRFQGAFTDFYYAILPEDTCFGKGFLSTILLNTGIRVKRVHGAWAGKGPIIKLFERTDRDFLIMALNKKLPLLPIRDLYSERLKAVNYFARVPGFSLYGRGWLQPTVYPRFLDYRALRQSYRGTFLIGSAYYETLSRYTFSLCFENCSFPGWITERIFDSFACGTIPVYLGAPDIDQHIPRNCYIDYRTFEDVHDLHEHLLSLSSQDIQEYKAKIKDFFESRQFEPFKPESFAKWFLQTVSE